LYPLLNARTRLQVPEISSGACSSL
jgi:hypothetical protein